MHIGLTILLLIFEGVKCAYVHVGCYKDHSNRAISGGFVRYDTSVVLRKCLEKAKQNGNEYFAVQYNVECFTSPDAGDTYDKYGRTTGCKLGRGGSWMMDVYRIPDIASRLGNINSNYENRWNEEVKTCTGGCEQEYNSFAGDMEIVALGLEAGSSLIDIASSAIDEKKFKKIAGTMGKFAPFLGALGPVVGIIAAFGDSEEMQRLNFVVDMLSEGFQEINRRFNRIELRIDELQNLLKQEHIDTRNYDPVNQLVNINKLVEEYFRALADNENSYAVRKADDLRELDSACWSAVETLINAFTGKAGYPEICMSLAVAMNGHRKNVMAKVLPLYTNLIRGVSDYLLIESLIDGRDMNNFKKEYDKKLKDVYNSIAECDETLESTLWLDWWKNDLTAAWGAHHGGGEKHLAKKINEVLSSKYYWRDWLIAVWGDAHGSDKHWQMHCPGDHTFHKLHWNHKNIIVTSVSPSKSTKARWLNVDFPTDHSYNAKSLWERIPNHIRTCTYPVSGVVRSDYNLELIAPTNRRYHKYVQLKRCWSFSVWHWFGSKQKWACGNADAYDAYILG